MASNIYIYTKYILQLALLPLLPLLCNKFFSYGNRKHREDDQHRNVLLMFLCRPLNDPRYGRAAEQQECASPAKACI
jgi:hypothetical protein